MNKSFINNENSLQPYFAYNKTDIFYLNSENVLGVVNFGQASLNNNLDSNIPSFSIEISNNKTDYFMEAWLTSAQVQSYKISDFSFGVDGNNLFGCVSLKLCNNSDNLVALIEKTYLHLFYNINKLGYPYLYRMWNYIPAINEEVGLEKYKSFCLGRNCAFNKYYNNSDNILPAATGIGKNNVNSINIYFLASKHRNMIHLENSRQVPAYKYPAKYGPKPPSFARATLINYNEDIATIYISGTASIIGSETINKGDPYKQCCTTIENIKHLISQENLNKHGVSNKCTIDNMDFIKIYYRRKQDLPIIKEYCENKFAVNSKKMYMNVDICRKDLLVEIEGVCQLTK